MSNVDQVIKIAEAEVGYLEKKTNSNLDDKIANAGSNNYTKYWRDLAPGMNGQAWCNCFVNWIFVQAYGLTEAKRLLCTDNGWSYYTPTSASYFKTKKQWYISSPKKGDIIYFKNSTRIHHVGLVYKVDNTYVYTIEGNTSAGSAVVANGGGVAKKKYLLTNSAIAGYGRPKYDTVENVVTSSSTSNILYTKKDIQNYLNNNYGKEIKNILGTELVIDGSFGAKSKKGLAIAIQIELNKLGANIIVDGDFGTNSKKAWDSKVGKLNKGSKGIFVTLWQCLLVGFGASLSGGIDGDFGSGTITATNWLFVKNGLEQDSNVTGSDVNKLI